MRISSALTDASVVVIGAGAVGSCIGYRLAQAGAKVTIVDRSYPGGGTSGNTFAWLNAFAKFPRKYYRLSSDSIRAHRDLEWELNGNWLTLNGGLHWQSTSGYSQSGDLGEILRRMQSWGARIDSYSAAEVMRNIEPGLRLDTDEVETVYLLRDEGWVQPVLMIQALLQRAINEYGAKFISGSVHEMTGSDEEVTGVVLGSGERLEADVVLVACGPASAQVAALAGARLPIESNYGILAVTPPAPAMIERVIVAPDILVRPDGGGRIIASSEGLSSVPGETQPSENLAEVKKLKERLEDLVPGLRGVPFETFRRGVRALPKDGFPIVGFDPDVHGLYHAVMHSGITLSAGIADLVAQDLSDPDFDGLVDFRPDRFAAGRTIQGPAGE